MHTFVGLLDSSGARNSESAQLGLSSDSGHGSNWLRGSDEERHYVCDGVVCSWCLFKKVVGVFGRVLGMGINWYCLYVRYEEEVKYQWM